MNGSCLCGSIRYTCNAEPLLTAVCHCPHCQKQSGTSFSVIVAVPKDSLRIAGQTLKTFDDVGESGLPVQRRFCGKCGSPSVCHLEAMPDLAFIKSGHPGEHLLAQPDDGGLVRDGTALDRHRRDETARGAQSAAGGLVAMTTLSQNPL